MIKVFSACFPSLPRTIQQAQTQGSNPFVVLVAPTQGPPTITDQVIHAAWRVPTNKILTVQAFDGDPFHFPDEQHFSFRDAQKVCLFLNERFWGSGCSLIVTCPSGRVISPSICNGIVSGFPGYRFDVSYSDRAIQKSGRVFKLVVDAAKFEAGLL